MYDLHNSTISQTADFPDYRTLLGSKTLLVLQNGNIKRLNVVFFPQTAKCVSHSGDSVDH